MGKNYYKILGIDRKASPQEIRKAFLKLSRDLHPDKNNDDDSTAKFQELKKAYETLNGLCVQKCHLFPKQKFYRLFF